MLALLGWRIIRQLLHRDIPSGAVSHLSIAEFASDYVIAGDRLKMGNLSARFPVSNTRLQVFREGIESVPLSQQQAL